MTTIPMAETSPVPPRRSLILVTPLAAAWIVFMLVAPLAGCAISALHFIHSAVGHRRGWWLTLVLSPLLGLPAWGFAKACVGYVRGDAALMMVGLPSDEARNLNPDLRCAKRTTGCVVCGWEPFANAGNNVALRGLIHTFGPMKGSYVGPYPTREEAAAALRGAKETVAFTPDPAALNAALGLPPPPSAGLARMMFYRFDTEPPKLSVARIPGGTVIVGNEERAVLIEAATGKPYAQYRLFPAPK
ncbi:MAG: hypothetical protein K8T20_00560 [Planctomycetes bacterium]|nr:hypothetical protein [Planctomycetota bacterium]